MVACTSHKSHKRILFVISEYRYTNVHTRIRNLYGDRGQNFGAVDKIGGFNKNFNDINDLTDITNLLLHLRRKSRRRILRVFTNI